MFAQSDQTLHWAHLDSQCCSFYMWTTKTDQTVWMGQADLHLCKALLSEGVFTQVVAFPIQCGSRDPVILYRLANYS